MKYAERDKTNGVDDIPPALIPPTSLSLTFLSTVLSASLAASTGPLGRTTETLKARVEMGVRAIWRRGCCVRVRNDIVSGDTCYMECRSEVGWAAMSVRCYDCFSMNRWINWLICGVFIFGSIGDNDVGERIMIKKRYYSYIYILYHGITRRASWAWKSVMYDVIDREVDRM